MEIEIKEYDIKSSFDIEWTVGSATIKQDGPISIEIEVTEQNQIWLGDIVLTKTADYDGEIEPEEPSEESSSTTTTTTGNLFKSILLLCNSEITD